MSAEASTRASRLAAWAEPVASARYVDATRADALAKLDIATIGQLVMHVPFRYLDLTSTPTLAQARPGVEATVVGRVHRVTVKKPKPRLSITEVAIVDGTGALIGVWFNQPWVHQRFAVGDSVAFAGKVELDYGMKQIKTPFVEKLADRAEAPSPGRVIPVHRATEGLTTGWLRRLIAAAVDDYANVSDHLPVAVRLKRDLVSLSSALRDVHFPVDLESARNARRRLAYDELLSLQVYMALRRHALTAEQAGVTHVTDGPKRAALAKAMPFALTGDQERAVAEILADMGQPRPMNRMLLGDVGTGKTAVAAHALAAVADTGSQAAMMAPTEVLAIQYAEKVGPLLEAAGISWRLLTGSTPTSERKQILAQLASGELAVLFGTHALLESDVEFARLTLAVVDEQHRFGVNQRLGLRGKGASADLLVMTATPIPRSLALTLYGDLATSYLRERPGDRPPVKTKLVTISGSQRALDSVRAAARAGQQAYIVCALVEESETAEAKAATREAERLRNQVFPDLRVDLLTGRMKPAEKADVMRRFRAGEIDVLVSTTVIEVGVDVPNATVMIVENADRFGLAQLHQLRGRVGRGEHPGEVWLVSDARSRESRERLAVLEGTSDGFELAEHDLRIRGEGRVFGDRQHGMPDLRVANLLDDLDIVEMARVDAFEIVAGDPHLTAAEHAPLMRRVHQVYESAWKWVSSG
ncbi:MAG TPA: ATP-dependent DNA helicase RecG [Coriobacteriia bacterium]|nr:ATP-dependent DNA helicase RecG [Coriobacteriia bacterium]